MFPDYTFLVTVVTWTNSSMQNSMVMVMFISVFDWEYLFLGKLDPKNGNYQLRLKFITYNHFHNILRFFDVGCWTLVDSVLWNHTCLFVRPSVRLSICPSVHRSVRPSVSFLKILSLVFSDIVHDDNWLWYLVVDEARCFKKFFGSPILGQMGQNWAQK